MKRNISLLLLPVLVTMGGCATVPVGPSLMALPGTGMSFAQFRADEEMCRQYARQLIGGATPNQVAVESGVASAVVGTAVGAAAGAALGGRHGAEVGAGAGLLTGGVVGSESGRYAGYEAQKRYDHGYIQCMYAQGHQVPVSGYGLMSRPGSSSRNPGGAAGSSSGARPGDIPPPPPGPPPPPPPELLPR